MYCKNIQILLIALLPLLSAANPVVEMRNLVARSDECFEFFTLKASAMEESHADQIREMKVVANKEGGLVLGGETKSFCKEKHEKRRRSESSGGAECKKAEETVFNLSSKKITLNSEIRPPQEVLIAKEAAILKFTKGGEEAEKEAKEGLAEGFELKDEELIFKSKECEMAFFACPVEKNPEEHKSEKRSSLSSRTDGSAEESKWNIIVGKSVVKKSGEGKLKRGEEKSPEAEIEIEFEEAEKLDKKCCIEIKIQAEKVEEEQAKEKPYAYGGEE